VSFLPWQEANGNVFLNADMPHLYCLVRNEYLYDLQRGHGQVTPCAVFLVTSLPPRALLFTCMLDNGAQIARLPISAFVHKPDAPVRPLDWLQLWGAFSHEIAVTPIVYLKDLRCRVLLKDHSWVDGRYVLTFDWCNSAYADEPGEGGHKTAHLIALNEGTYCLQPNTRIQWFEASFITRPFPERPDYLTNSHVWHCEHETKWATEDSARLFYDVQTLPG